MRNLHWSCMSVCVSVCLSLAAFPHYCTDQDVSWGNGREYPLVMHCLADLQFVYEFCCCDNIEPNTKCQRVLVLALCLVWKSNQGPVFEMPCTASHNVASISNCWNGVNVHISLRTCSAELQPNYNRTSRINLVTPALSMVLLEWYRPPVGPI